MDERERLQDLEQQKGRMIAQYMALQDRADAVNAEIYKLCCGIETLNSEITVVREELLKAAPKGAPKNGGSAHPVPGADAPA